MSMIPSLTISGRPPCVSGGINHCPKQLTPVSLVFREISVATVHAMLDVVLQVHAVRAVITALSNYSQMIS